MSRRQEENKSALEGASDVKVKFFISNDRGHYAYWSWVNQTLAVDPSSHGSSQLLSQSEIAWPYVPFFLAWSFHQSHLVATGNLSPFIAWHFMLGMLRHHRTDGITNRKGWGSQQGRRQRWMSLKIPNNLWWYMGTSQQNGFKSRAQWWYKTGTQFVGNEYTISLTSNDLSYYYYHATVQNVDRLLGHLTGSTSEWSWAQSVFDHINTGNIYETIFH